MRHADYSRRFARGKGTAAGKRAGIQTATSHATQRPDSEQIDWREKHPYLAYREGGKVKTRYVKPEELEQVAAQVARRQQFEQALKSIRADLRVIGKVVKDGK